VNRVVVRYQDGRVSKGLTNDFLPMKDHFHLALSDQGAGAKPVDVHVSELKAVFFVKTFEGDPEHHKSNEPAPATPGGGRLLRVVFKDGEVIVGMTQGYDRSRPGFFVVPVDKASNNERCFVVAAAVAEVVLG